MYRPLMGGMVPDFQRLTEKLEGCRTRLGDAFPALSRASIEYRSSGNLYSIFYCGSS